jgi:predicted unusual protein kinase regulating ubiquinone biosynthesis (AarF/ABC1/UbiB family)
MNFFKSKKFEKIKKISKFGKSYTDFLYLTKIKRIDNKNLGIWTKNKLIESGTTFIKIGQLISTRSDLFDKDFLFELKGLQDNILPIPFEQLEYFILPIKSELEYIDPNQIASASIGQVHKAILKNGDKIVIKFKRPNIEKKIHEDFEFLLGIIKFIKNISNDRKINEFEILFNEYYLLLKE